jgi:hypothetical protein
MVTQIVQKDRTVITIIQSSAIKYTQCNMWILFNDGHFGMLFVHVLNLISWNQQLYPQLIIEAPRRGSNVFHYLLYGFYTACLNNEVVGQSLKW